MTRLLYPFFLFIAFSSFATSYLEYSFLPDLPPNSDYETQPGLAGAYSGIDNNVLIVAGGANFPDALPWDGGKKVYYNEIFVLLKQDKQLTWSLMEQTIPEASGYGGAISTPYGLLCFGGNTADNVIDKSWFIKYNTINNSISITPAPSLPLPLTNFAASVVNNKVYIAGGISTDKSAGNYFLCLDLDQDISNWKWEKLQSWSGKPRAFSVAATQSNGIDNCFYLFSGRKVISGKDPEILYDAHFYNPKTKAWKIISDGSNKDFPIMAGTAFPVGASTIVFPSGANGEFLKKELHFKNQISKCQNIIKQGSLKQALLNHLKFHRGFGNKVYTFNTLTNEFALLDSLPTTGQVTTNAIKWNNGIIIPNGEIKPGVRTPKILQIKIKEDQSHLSITDIIVIGLYFLVLALMGYYFSKRQKNTTDYFKGGGRIPWWAAGLSIFGTALSAITFMAIPAKTFATDWAYFMLNMTIFLVAPVIVFLFIPYYRKLNITTAYEYLEVRFNLVIRLIGSISFILFQIGRMGVVLFLPSIALNVVTGIDIYVCIALMGVIALVYTMMGGIEAVIWTDVMQVIVLLGGAILSLILIISSIDGGFCSILETANNNNKFNTFNLDLSLTQPTVWVMLLGGLFANLTTYGTDQTMVQRYLTTKTKAEANKSVWTNAILTIPATIIFFFVGTALFAFFKAFPTELNPTFANNDAIFPWYIISQLPKGIAGLLIAAIFAAAMSSLSSSMNSAATSWATDIHFRFGWNKQQNQLNLARKATLIIGLAGIIFALLMASMDVKSLWDEFQKVLGLVIGSLGGVFLLGVLTKKSNSRGVLIGIVISIITQIIISYYQPVHLLLYATTGVISCFIAGYVASMFFKLK